MKETKRQLQDLRRMAIRRIDQIDPVMISATEAKRHWVGLLMYADERLEHFKKVDRTKRTKSTSKRGK